jgi:hypothetical protein
MFSLPEWLLMPDTKTQDADGVITKVSARSAARFWTRAPGRGTTLSTARRPGHYAADMDLDRRLRRHDGVVVDSADRAARRDDSRRQDTTVVRLLLGHPILVVRWRRKFCPT